MPKHRGQLANETATIPLNDQRSSKSNARLRVYTLLSAILLISLLFSIGCQSESPPAANENDGSPTISSHTPPSFVIQPHGIGKVIVEVGTPESLMPFIEEIRLNKINGDEVIKGKKLDPQSRQTLEVDSGFYFIEVTYNNNSGVTSYPLPALGRSDRSPISIAISPPSPTMPDWCWIPPGPSVHGDTLGIGREDERPVRITNLNGFWICDHEVTNQEYARFLSSTFASTKGVPEGWLDLRSKKCLIHASNEGSFTTDFGDLPVVMVSLEGAKAYCKWLTETTNVNHRLPTELEWEKAARGPESFVFSYGNIYYQAKANQESGKLKPVKSYSPNSYGLYDMTGNVFEWMSNVADPSKQDKTLNHSLRGGSFVLDGMYLRNSFRMSQSPTVMTDDIGFRVVRDRTPNTR